MAGIFGVFNSKKTKFNIEEPKEPKKPVRETARVSSVRRDASRPERKKHVSKEKDKPRARRTIYSETINVDKEAKVDPSLFATSQIESIRAGKKKRMRTWSVFAVVLALALTVFFVFLCMRIFFKVGRIECVGIDKYDTDEIIEYTGIKIGDGLYSVNRQSVQALLHARYPYLINVRIIRELPDGIVISAEEDTAAYYTEFGGRCYVLSDSLRLLEYVPDIGIARERYPELLEVSLPPVKEAIIGEEVVFMNENYTGIVKQVISDIESCERADKIKYIDIEDRYSISAEYAARITVRLGDYKDLASKLRFAFAIIDDFPDTSKGEVNVGSVEKGYADLN